MKYFTGLDVSLEETAICIVDEAGAIVKELRAASEPDALVEALQGVAWSWSASGWKPARLLAWLHEGERFLSRNFRARRKKKIPGGARTDFGRSAGHLHRDAASQCEDDAEQDGPQRCPGSGADHAHGLVQAGACQEPGMPVVALLLVARRTVLNEMRSIENVVRAILREAGIKLGTPSRTAFADRVRELTGGDAPATPLVAPLLTILATMLRELARLTKQVFDIVRAEKVCRRLMSVPGVGPITALAFRATIDRPNRFRRSRDVGAHLGLMPARYQSGETDIQGKVSRCGDELARTALYEAAHTLLVCSRKWSSLRAWGMKIAKHRGMARARVAVARKLAVVLHRTWSDETAFCFGLSPA